MPGAGQPTPKPLLDKLGVKPGARVSIVGLREDGFLALLRSRTGEITTGRAKRGSDLIFVFVAHREELDARVAPLRDHLKPDGAIWVVRPKGIPDMKEVDVIDAGKRAGLVDNKIASFSESLSAMRLVIPLALR